MSTSSSSNNSNNSPPGLENLYTRTPLLESLPLSNRHSRPIYLKLDALQPSGSFKDRGMSRLCTELARNNVTQFVSSSGGNAGHSAAYVGRRLGVPVKVIVPKTTKELMLTKIRSQGATVEVVGDNWNEADEYARRLVEESGGECGYIPPYEHESLWAGHATVVKEIVEDLGGVPPDAIVVSVGGGGLLCGVLEGLKDLLSASRDGKKVTVVAAETKGADSFRAAWDAGTIVSLDGITSVATSLGALSVSPTALSRAKEHRDEGRGGVESVVVRDEDAVRACWDLAEGHRLLVEPACGAALAALEGLRDVVEGNGPIVVVVCGGSAITPEMLQDYKKQYL
eukprot:CAMPEP_0172508004 /NCGR_PEP_ID=MMETSP1066-20121228/208422_1 /TAXON_ID=671091 /ORGANISM="Coscinodiscus wailesii, Strain CCMP2513" /LENGTH=339 /DNA_ID=CAMNT_0013285783 /DNA_START=119 /DNA_END=1138 /DNA_ORIENTATION=+